MLEINYSTFHKNLESCFETVSNSNVPMLVTEENEKNIVVMSCKQYSSLMKAAGNAEYLLMLDQAIEQLTSGNGQQHELIEVND